MSGDLLKYAATIASFATLATVHLSLAVGLSRRGPRWRGPASLVLPPLAPFWGYREGFKARTVLWVVSVVGYGASLVASYRDVG